MATEVEQTLTTTVADLFLGEPSQSRKTKTAGYGSADRLLAESYRVAT